MSKYPSAPKVSPLHTSKATAAVKAAAVSKMGRDKDGAYRYARRFDGQN